MTVTREYIVVTKPEGAGYVSTVPDFPDIRVTGTTSRKVLAGATRRLQARAKAADKRGVPMPEPRFFKAEVTVEIPD